MDDRVRVPFFYAITIIATLVILLYWRQTPVSHRLVRFALALIFSGAIGNFTDRFSLGYVIDFIDVRWLIPLPFAINLSWDFFPSFLGFLNQNINISAWQYNFPNFNWADSMVTIGVSLIIIDKETRPPRRIEIKLSILATLSLSIEFHFSDTNDE